MVKRATPFLKNSGYSGYRALFFYPQYYRRSVLETFLVSRSVLMYLSMLGFRPGRIRVSNFSKNLKIDVFGLLPHHVRKKTRSYTFLFHSLRLVRAVRRLGSYYVRRKSNFSPVFFFNSRLFSNASYKIASSVLLSGCPPRKDAYWFFSRLVVLLSSSLMLPSSIAFDKRLVSSYSKRSGLRRTDHISSERLRLKLMLVRTFFKLRSEYTMSIYFHVDACINYQDVSLLCSLSNYVAQVFKIPVRGFYKYFKSARAQVFISSLFAGFFVSDLDLLIRQISYGLRRSRRRQYSYVYHILPSVIKFSNYYNTIFRGLRLIVRGKLGGRTRTRIYVLESLKMPGRLFRQAFDSTVQYRFADVRTYTGIFGLHLYVYAADTFRANSRLLES